MQLRFWFFVIFALVFLPTIAQEPDDGLGNFTDAFQDCFFEALKQSNIENHQRAVLLFNQCKEMNDKESALYFQLGKNYLSLKQYAEAERNLLKAQELDPDNVWYHEALFDFYGQTGQPDKQIETGEMLLSLGRDFRENLIQLYFENKNLEKAQSHLAKYKEKHRNNVTVSVWEDRLDALSRSLNRREGLQADAANVAYYRNNLKDLLKEKNLKTYLELSDNWLKVSATPEAKAYAIPRFAQVDDSLQLSQAFEALLSYTAIDKEVRWSLVDSALQYAEKHSFKIGETPFLNNWVNTHETTPSNKSRFINYFLAINENNSALALAETLLENDATSFQALSVKVKILNRNRAFAQAQDLAEQALGLYPAQPVFYLESAKAMLGLNRPKSAAETLLSGLDFIFDNSSLQNDFYSQLASAYKLMGNVEREQFYRAKIINIP